MEKDKAENQNVGDDELSTIQYRHLIELYIKKDKQRTLKEKEILTYCQAWLYQPALEFGKGDDETSYKYVLHRPTSLSRYLHMFRHVQSDISISKEEVDDEEEVELIKCCGIDNINLPQIFLQSDGYFTCAQSQTTFYNTCGYTPSKDRNDKTKIMR